MQSQEPQMKDITKARFGEDDKRGPSRAAFRILGSTVDEITKKTEDDEVVLEEDVFSYHDDDFPQETQAPDYDDDHIEMVSKFKRIWYN